MKRFAIEREGRVQIWRIDHPPHNFMDRVMVAELEELVSGLERDRGTGAVVVTGKPRELFLTHYDVAEILAGAEGVGMEVAPGLAGASLRAVGGLARVPGARAALDRSPASGLVELRRLHELWLRMNRLDKVFVAAINGPAGGGGCELALACDLRYMADDAGMIGLPEMSLGFPPGAGGTQRLSRVLGPAKALELMLDARALAPEEAFEAGLVHRVVPAGRLLDAALESAERYARRAPVSVAALKRAVYEGASASLAEGLHVERKWFLAAASRPESQAAMRRYAEQVERDGEPAWADEEKIRAWQQGTEVDMTGEAD
jgi:enoyl-CoA hydratase/carnithine racemase